MQLLTKIQDYFIKYYPSVSTTPNKSTECQNALLKLKLHNTCLHWLQGENFYHQSLSQTDLNHRMTAVRIQYFITHMKNANS
jgi:hypothetical protein